MSESKHPCPFCERPIGGVHTDHCPRSRVRQAVLQTARRLSILAATRNLIWTSVRLICINPFMPEELRKYRKELVQGTWHGHRASKHGTFTRGLMNLLKAAQQKLAPKENADGAE